MCFGFGACELRAREPNHWSVAGVRVGAYAGNCRWTFRAVFECVRDCQGLWSCQRCSEGVYQQMDGEVMPARSATVSRSSACPIQGSRTAWRGLNTRLTTFTFQKLACGVHWACESEHGSPSSCVQWSAVYPGPCRLGLQGRECVNVIAKAL